jgi:plasmid maintenance system antidote protein VapI
MLVQDLHRAESGYRIASLRAEARREHRDGLVREAVAAGWTHARVAEATGLTRGRVNQIVHGRR